MKKFTDDQIYQANQVSLLELTKELGYHPEKRGINYHIKDYGGLYISDEKNSFYCWAAETGGGPIQFLMKFENMNWVEAMKYLVGESQGLQAENKGMKWQKPTERKQIEFKLPEKSQTSYKRLFAYLLKARGLDKDIVMDLVNQKKIYESHPHHNVVFVGYDENGQARQAFQRGTVTGVTFKGEVPGGDKTYCFAMEGKGDSLTVYEAAIDAISHASILKHFGMSWKKEHRIALGCLSDHALEGYLKMHPEITKITFALDDDYDAKFADGSPAPNWGQKAAQNFAKKYEELGYRTSIEKPTAKDWNDDLMNLHLSEQQVQKMNENSHPDNSNLNNQEELEEAM